MKNTFTKNNPTSAKLSSYNRIFFIKFTCIFLMVFLSGTDLFSQTTIYNKNKNLLISVARYEHKVKATVTAEKLKSYTVLAARNFPVIENSGIPDLQTMDDSENIDNCLLDIRKPTAKKAGTGLEMLVAIKSFRKAPNSHLLY